MDEGQNRVRIFTVLILIIFGILSLRLVKLQIVDSSSHTGESQNNSMREIRVQAPRGRFFDRNGVLMVENEPTYTLYVTPLYFDDANIAVLANLLSVADTTIARQVQAARDWSPFKRSPIRSGVTLQALGRVLEQKHRLDGIDYEVTQKRRYVTGARATHALGYVREISDAALSARRDEQYRRGDQMGQSGLELEYESVIRGQTGSEFKLVNIRGQVVDDYLGGDRDLPTISGMDLTLTIDHELQALAESLFVNKRGAVIAIDPVNGEVLAMHSAPDYDLTMFTERLDPREWNKVLTSKDKPLFNRVTQSVFPPGSTFKPLIALLALSTGAINANYTYYCDGGHPRGKSQDIFKCLGEHGSINVIEALKQSCNTFFFEMMRIVDVNSLNDLASSFGFGLAPGVDIAGSEIRGGLVPDSSYYNERYGQAPRYWNEGTTMNLGVGQGDIQVSPLQLVLYMSALANGGTLVSPHLVREMVDSKTGEKSTPEIAPGKRIELNPFYLSIVREGMQKVISEKNWWLAIPGVPSFGKTGSAQNSRGDQSDSVFIMAAPIDNPRIAIAVFVENAGYGSTAAGPIGSLMVEKYITGSIDPARTLVWDMVADNNSAPIIFN